MCVRADTHIQSSQIVHSKRGPFIECPLYLREAVLAKPANRPSEAWTENRHRADRCDTYLTWALSKAHATATVAMTRGSRWLWAEGRVEPVKLEQGWTGAGHLAGLSG